MGDKVYKNNSPVKVVFQTLGGQTGLTDLSMVVTDPSGNDSLPVTMTELSNGLYEASFTPDEIGRWWVEVTSSSYPENGSKQSYLIGLEEGISRFILTDEDGHIADISSAGRILVEQEPPTPPTGTTGIIRTEYGNVITTDDNEYLIPNGETIILQRFSGGGEDTNAGSVIELWYDPNGTGIGMVIIDAIFCNGSSDQHILNDTYIGDGTKKIRMIRKRLSGGGVLLFGRWEGYY